MTPLITILSEFEATQKDLESMLRQKGVELKVFAGRGILDGFSIVKNGVRYIAIDASLSQERQWSAAIRELSQFARLQEGQSSLFFANYPRYQAEADTRKGA